MMQDEENSYSEKDQKRKRKNNTNSNPLSQARGKQHRHENIWFRRSGIGYALFVQYYSNQPIGTVCQSIAEAGGASQQQTPQKGMSRAAKKRRKQKGKSDNNSATTTSSSDVQDSSLVSVNKEELEASPLLQAWTKYCKLQQQQVANKKSKKVTLMATFLPFFKTLSRPLPLTIRIRNALLNEEKRESIQQLTNNYVHPDCFQLVPWSDKYSTIYQATAKSALSKPTLSRTRPDLHRSIVNWSESGILARQEIGSMLPVIVLHQLTAGLKAGSRILDMCASPGSKTLQALEICCDSQKKPRGRIIANDVLQARLDTLQQAVQRSGISEEMTSRITYSCQDASKLDLPQTKLEWTFVLCDVPCSGDGTIRKDKHILPMWKPQLGNNLHSTQLRILIRALELVAVGGIVCYSTCSLNPVEDEAVVVAALHKINKTTKVGLVDVPPLNGFKRRPGIATWKVANFTESDEQTELQWYSSWKEAYDSKLMKSPVKTLWPPESSEGLNLDRCMRLWPHDHDTGGFFLALFQKLE